MAFRPLPPAACVALLVMTVGLAACGDEGPSASPDATAPATGGASSAQDWPGAPRVGSSARVWAVGDAAGRGEAPRRVARMIGAGRPELLLYLGDVYPAGSAKDFRNYDRLYGRLARRTAPTIGNHEAPNRRSGYDPYWRAAHGRGLPRYYSFRAAGWTILSLDSEAKASGILRQATWLRRQLRTGGNCRLAFWHRPRYSAGLVHGDSLKVAPLWNALRGRARLVLNGHEHDFQQRRRRDGITELVAGAGGNGRYPVARGDRRLAFADAANDGALRLELSPGRARFAFVSVSGRVLHRGSASCTAG